VLPESERIYYKDFHFLDEPLIDRQNKREAVAAEKKAIAAVQQTSVTSETPSVSTAAGSSMMATKGTTKIQKGIVKTVEDYEESKSMSLPIFSNQKDILN
jgi:hypothetical protein